MRLYHYTNTPPEAVAGRTQEKSSGRKPVGFWLSDCDAGMGWREWCEMEDFCLEGLSYRLLVDVEMSKILHLKNASEIDDFGIDFSKDYNFGSYVTYLIDWGAVAEQWSGILISPYQWSRRLDGAASDWYYTWDCASACVWSPDAISRMEIDQSWQREYE